MESTSIYSGGTVALCLQFNIFYIEFCLSGWYPQGQEPATAVGVWAQIKDLPEFSSSAPYNLFKLDICQLGCTVLLVIKVNNPTLNHVPHTLTVGRSTQF